MGEYNHNTAERNVPASGDPKFDPEGRCVQVWEKVLMGNTEKLLPSRPEPGDENFWMLGLTKEEIAMGKEYNTNYNSPLLQEMREDAPQAYRGGKFAGANDDTYK